MSFLFWSIVFNHEHANRTNQELVQLDDRDFCCTAGLEWDQVWTPASVWEEGMDKGGSMEDDSRKSPHFHTCMLSLLKATLNGPRQDVWEDDVEEGHDKMIFMSALWSPEQSLQAAKTLQLVPGHPTPNCLSVVILYSLHQDRCCCLWCSCPCAVDGAWNYLTPCHHLHPWFQ